jgi:hypothetical protein
MNAEQQLRVHQLLGRIVYFHCLFIEPFAATVVLEGAAFPDCCSHRQTSHGLTSGLSLADTAWGVLLDLTGSTIGSCRPRSGASACCPECQVYRAGAGLALMWIAVERAEYGHAPADPETIRGWAQTVGERLAGAFAEQHLTACGRARPAPELGGAVLEAPKDLPITAELLALWADPTIDSAPVVSWLNHCAALADVGRVMQSRRTAA